MTRNAKGMGPSSTETRVLLFPEQPLEWALNHAWIRHGVEFSHMAENPNASLDEFLAGYMDAHRHFRNSDFILYGENETADLLLKHYYDFLAVRSPAGLILANVVPDVFLLNQIACPYLLIRVPEPGETLYIERAIKHHVYRFGDPTKHFDPRIEKDLPEAIALWVVRVALYRSDPGHWREILQAHSAI